MRNYEVAIRDVEEEHSARTKCAEDPLRDRNVLLFFEVAETRIPAENAVEHLFEGHLAHVALKQVQFLPRFLRDVGRHRELIKRQVVPDDSVSALGELDGVKARTAS